MAEIPTFDVNEHAAPERLPLADPQAFAAPGQGLAQAGAAIGGLGEEWEQRYAEARRQQTASGLVADYGKQAEDLYWKYSKVADAQAASQGFATDFAALRKQALGATTDPLVQSYVQRELDQRGVILSTQTRHDAFQLEASKHAGDLDTQAQDLLQRLPAAPNDLYRATLHDQYSAAVNGAVAAHWITPEDGSRRLLSFRAGAAEAQVLHDMATDPMAAWRGLNDPSAYPGLPAERRGYYQWRLEPRALQTSAEGIADSIVPLPKAVPAQYGPALQQATAGTGVPSDLVAAVSQTESGWDPNAVSKTGARGLMQVLPSTAQQPGYGVAPIDPAQLGDAGTNLRFGAQYIAGLGRKYGVTDWSDPAQVRPVLMAYHGAGDATDAQYADAVLHARGGSGAPLGPEQEPALVARAVAAAGDDPRLQEAAARAVMSRLSMIRAAGAVDRAGLERDLKDLRPALLAGADVPIPEDRIRALLPAQQASDTLRDLTVAQLGGQVLKSVQWGSPAEVAEAARDLDSGMGAQSTMLRLRLARAGVPGVTDATDGGDSAASFNVRKAIAAELQRQLAARQSAIAADPAGYAAQNPAVAAAAAAVDPKQPGTFEAYAAATQGLQRHLGVADADLRVLPMQQAQKLAQTLTQADPEKLDAGGALDQMAAQYGQAWPAVWHDLVRDGKLPPTFQVLGQMLPGPDRAAMQRALQAEAKKGGPEALRADLAAGDAQAIDHDLPDALADFRRTVMVPGLSGDTGLYDAVRGATQTLARWNVLNGDPPGRALQRAVDAALPYDFEGLARAPKGQGALAASYASSLLGGLKPEDLAPVAGGQGMADADRQAAYLRSLQRNGTWITNERGTGWFLAIKGSDGAWQPATRRDGSRIGFAFADMKPSDAPDTSVQLQGLP